MTLEWHLFASRQLQQACVLQCVSVDMIGPYAGCPNTSRKGCWQRRFCPCSPSSIWSSDRRHIDNTSVRHEDGSFRESRAMCCKAEQTRSAYSGASGVGRSRNAFSTTKNTMPFASPTNDLRFASSRLSNSGISSLMISRSDFRGPCGFAAHGFDRIPVQVWKQQI